MRQRQTDQPRDEGELALEHAALYDKIPHQLHCRAGQHHAAQRIADHAEAVPGTISRKMPSAR